MSPGEENDAAAGRQLDRRIEPALEPDLDGPRGDLALKLLRPVLEQRPVVVSRRGAKPQREEILHPPRGRLLVGLEQRSLCC